MVSLLFFWVLCQLKCSARKEGWKTSFQQHWKWAYFFFVILKSFVIKHEIILLQYVAIYQRCHFSVMEASVWFFFQDKGPVCCIINKRSYTPLSLFPLSILKLCLHNVSMVCKHRPLHYFFSPTSTFTWLLLTAGHACVRLQEKQNKTTTTKSTDCLSILYLWLESKLNKTIWPESV